MHASYNPMASFRQILKTLDGNGRFSNVWKTKPNQITWYDRISFVFDGIFARGAHQPSSTSLQRHYSRMAYDDARISTIRHTPTFNMSYYYSTKIQDAHDRGNYKEAVDLFNEMKLHLRPNTVVYNMMLNCLTKAGDNMGLNSLLEEMVANGIQVNKVTFNTLLTHFGKLGAIQHVQDLFEMMRKLGIEPDLINQVTVLAGLSNEQNDHIILKIYEDFKSQGTLNTTCFNVLLNCFGKRGKLDIMLQLFQEMKDLHIRPDLHTYNTIINSCATKVRTHKLLEILQEMKANSINPDHITFNTMLKAYIHYDESEKIVEVLASMQQHGIKPDVSTFNTLLDYFGKKGNTEKITETLENMRSSGVAPNTRTYTTLIDFFQSKGDKEQVEATVKKIRASNLPFAPHTYSVLMEHYCKQNDMEGVQNIWNEMKKMGARYSSPQNTYLNWLGRNGNTAQILKLLKEGQLLNTLDTFNHIIHWVGKDGSTEDLIESLERLVESGLKPDAYTIGSLMYYFHKKMYSKLLLHVWDTFVVQQRLRPNVVMYNVLLEHYAQLNQPEKAVEAFEDLHRHGLQPNLRTYASLMLAYGNLGNMDAIQKLYNAMRQQNIPDNIIVYNSILRCYALTGDTEGLMKTFHQLEALRIDPDIRTFSYVLEGLAKKGNLEEMFHWMTKMKTYNCFPNMKTYEIVLEVLAGQKDRSAVSNVLSVVQNTLKELTCAPFATVMQIASQQGDTDMLLDAFRRLKELKISADLTVYDVLGKHTDIPEVAQYLEEGEESRKSLLESKRTIEEKLEHIINRLPRNALASQ